MSYSYRSLRLLSIVVPLAALGFFFFLTAARIHRVDDVTHLVQTEVAVDAASPTGYQHGLRNFIVPEHNNESYQWIVQAQQMFAPDGHWRVREEHYDNAPVGRTVLTPSPYRWWFGFVGEIDHLVTGRPVGLSLERAARIADPILFILLLSIAVTLVGWRFGVGPASLSAIALVTLFPFGGAFVPAQPTDGGLVLLCVSVSLFLLLAGIQPARAMTDATAGQVPPPLDQTGGPADEQGARLPRWFFAAGVILGIALWIDAVRALPVLIGVGLGGILAVWSIRRSIKAGVIVPLLPWRQWALGGAATTLAAYLIEYYPRHLGAFNLREVHPLYGIAWLGLGELLARLNAGAQQPGSWRNGRALAMAALGVGAIAAVPVVLVRQHSGNLFTADPAATCLTSLTNSPIAANFWAWLLRDGFNLPVIATIAPLLMVVLAVLFLFTRATDWVSHSLLTITLGPVLVTAGFACFQLRSWNEFDVVSVGLLVAITVAAFGVIERKLLRGAWIALSLLILTPGAIVLTEKALSDRHDPVSEIEIQSLLERDLSQWLARQAGAPGAVILAPPNLTMSMIYHGGLSGLGTPFLENTAGFNAAMRIAGASSPDEAQAIATARNLRYIVMPSWDNFLEEYARQGASDVQHTLIAYLQRWLPPRWLRPVPYHLPKVAGFEGQSVAIFKVVEVQDNAAALSDLAEYFVEMEMPEQAMAVAHALEQSFPADLGAAVARTIVAHATQDSGAFEHAFKDLEASLDRGDGEYLAWDRRVSLAVALVDGRRLDQAKEEVKRCLAEIDETQLRSLTTVSLHRLLVMCRSFGLKIDNPTLSTLAQQLLPPELREQP